jgi:prepilin-type N-terminal cleavage/methylation domain-containing protein
MRATNERRHAFTIVEVMIAIAIFAMVIMAMYAVWTSILKGSRAAQNAAAAVQRSRIAVNALQESFRTAQLFTENLKDYVFLADTSGDLAAVSMVSRLSPAIPGFAVQRGLAMCRISFYTQPGPNGGNELVMTHAPILLDTNHPTAEPYSAVLAKDVTLFTLQFWDRQKNEYIDEWRYTNQLPPKVLIALGTGKTGASSTPQDVVVREVIIPSWAAVSGVQSGPPMGRPPGK